jgi:hypothetical protein
MTRERERERAPVPAGPIAVGPVMGSAPPVDVIPPPARWRRYHGWPRWIPIVAGAWLSVSIFLWPHSDDTWANTWLVGVLLMGFGALSLYKPWVRWLNVVLAVWLVISTLALPHIVPATLWNDLLVALAVLAATPLAIARAGDLRAARRA